MILICYSQKNIAWCWCCNVVSRLRWTFFGQSY